MGLSMNHMKRLAIISDIHGNIPALEAVIADIQNRNVSQIFCLGDLAGKGPDGAEAVDLIQQHCDVVVKGNWDWFLTEKSTEVLEWHQKQLGQDRLDYMRDLPIYHEFYMSGKLIRLCHASPHDLFHRTHIGTEMDERLSLFEPVAGTELSSDVIGYGDIHGAHVDHFDSKTIFNTGSVGNPLEIPQASYIILEGDLESRAATPFLISIVRVPYDIELAVQHAKDSDMPEKELYIDELRTAVYRGRRKS
jgi:protein phosphatase